VLRAVFAAVAATLVVPVSAQAALSFAFDRAQARPGQAVRAFQADADGAPAPSWAQLDGVTLYLAGVRNANHRVRLGTMTVDAAGVWSVDFRVPKVRPGFYAIAFACIPCGNTYFSSVSADERWTGEAGRVLKVRR
jgi:hypothetical protein